MFYINIIYIYIQIKHNLNIFLQYKHSMRDVEIILSIGLCYQH